MKKNRKPISTSEKLEAQFDTFAKETIKFAIMKVLQDYVNHRRNNYEVNLEDLTEVAAPEKTPDVEKIKVTLGSSYLLLDNDILAAGMEKLNGRHQRVLECALLLDMPDQATAELLDLNHQTIRNYKHQAYDILRRYMKEARGE